MEMAAWGDVARARRVLCYGVTGSGKSTAAVRLGQSLGRPVHLVDEEIGWLPGWVERPTEEQRGIASRIAADDSWILDSAYGKWLPQVIDRVEVVVALDYPRWVSLSRLLCRTLSRVITKEQMCNGNTESWRQLFSRNSIIRWHFASFSRRRARIAAWVADPDFPPVVRLRSPRDLDRLIRTLTLPPPF